MNLTFFLHITNDKQDQIGSYPIKAQLDCNGKRVQFGINKTRCLPENWCKDLQRAKPNSELINILLERVQKRFEDTRLECEKNKQTHNPS